MENNQTAENDGCYAPRPQARGWLARFIDAHPYRQAMELTSDPAKTKDDLIRELNRFRKVLGPLCDVVREFPNTHVTITAEHAKRIKEVCDLGRTNHVN